MARGSSLKREKMIKEGILEHQKGRIQKLGCSPSLFIFKSILQDPTMCCLQEAAFNLNDIVRLKIQGWKRDIMQMAIKRK